MNATSAKWTDTFFNAHSLAGAPNRIVVNQKDGSVLVHVQAGAFEMGDDKDSDAPKHMVELSEYWIGVNCVTNRQYEAFVKATGHRSPDGVSFGDDRPVWKNGTFPANKADHPVVCLAWPDAIAYAEWAGCGLPTEAQWEKAARGDLGFKYPWGQEWKPELCRNSGHMGEGPDADVREYSKGVSGYGTYQQSGTTLEWCRDWHSERYYHESPAKNPSGPLSGSDRVLRGSSWRHSNGSYFRAACRSRGVPDHRGDDRGFRLVREV